MVHLAQNDPVIKKLRVALAGTPFADKTYLVGGSVRDLLLGKQITDYDLCIEIPGGDVSLSEYLFSGGLCSSLQKYKNHNIISCNMQNCRLELMQTITSHSRTIEAEFGTLAQDAMGRDFTINSLYLSLQDLSLIDPTGRGCNDLKTGTISAVRDPAICFIDDPLRMLRALRFQLTLGLNIETGLWQGIREHAFRINSLPIERISDEIFLMLEYDLAPALELLQDSGILEQLSNPLYRALLNARQEGFSLQDLFAFLPEQDGVNSGFTTYIFLLWLGFRFGDFTESAAAGSSEAQSFTTALLQSVEPILLIPLKVQARIARIFSTYLYLAERLNEGKEFETALLFALDYLALDSPYLHQLLAWDLLSCFSEDRHIAKVMAVCRQYLQESAAHTFPLRGEDLLAQIEKSEYEFMGVYLLLLRLRWLQNPALGADSLLGALHQLRPPKIEPAALRHIREMLKQADWLWEWESWKSKKWI
ncbi:MAG: hypothetical protein M0Q16_06160 [Candidatus Cloacimonetes bacterium]|jgi:tRNA nucleotidyltransferase/poly(A) polymerase|nr:hypothetical protein [Candidatus Cloacimonadota bacterium]MCK9184937.1 hypothetical protein [Candidatus Cloacimonadota bacterium]MCK9583978.1 hypothetical protein [Candidatus Cloacimonadota bacterium]